MVPVTGAQQRDNPSDNFWDQRFSEAGEAKKFRLEAEDGAATFTLALDSRGMEEVEPRRE